MCSALSFFFSLPQARLHGNDVRRRPNPEPLWGHGGYPLPGQSDAGVHTVLRHLYSLRPRQARRRLRGLRRRVYVPTPAPVHVQQRVRRGQSPRAWPPLLRHSKATTELAGFIQKKGGRGGANARPLIFNPPPGENGFNKDRQQRQHDNQCESCFAGYRLTPEGFCVECENKECNPNQYRSGRCGEEGDTTTTFTCTMYGGTCLNGQLVGQDDRRQPNHCDEDKCKSGYKAVKAESADMVLQVRTIKRTPLLSTPQNIVA